MGPDLFSRSRTFARRRLGTAPLLAAAVASLGGAARAQEPAPAGPAAPRCDTVASRGTAGELSGARIRSVTVTPRPLPPLPGAARLLGHLHVTTRASTIRRDLEFAPGDTVDTLLVGESMRRLRQRGYVRDAQLRATRCGDSTDITVSTEDRWTLTPSLSAQANAAYGGIEERNLFGTGRTLSVLVASRQGKTGGAIGYTDPQLFWLPVYARVRAAGYADGSEARLRLRRAEERADDVWRPQLLLSHYRQDTRRVQRFDRLPVLVEQAFRRDGAFLVLGRRIGAVTNVATSVLVGFDFERASLNAPDRALTVGPKLVERRYHGPSVGLARHAVAFDTVSWLTHRQLLADVPLGLEMEGVIGAGREDVARRPAGFGSIWAGRVWLPTPDRLVLLDFWSSGYLVAGRHNVDAASTRALFMSYLRGRHAVYAVRLAGEKVVNPDPDVRALSLYDPTIPLIPEPYRLSENAVAAELSATRRLLHLSATLDLDGALFTAGSLRTASALDPHDHYGAVAIGTGVRVAPGGPGSGTLRLDLLYPLITGAYVRHTPRVALSVTPWLLANRQREDPRVRQ